jgi:hypothetical protein
LPRLCLMNFASRPGPAWSRSALSGLSFSCSCSSLGLILNVKREWSGPFGAPYLARPTLHVPVSEFFGALTLHVRLVLPTLPPRQHGPGLFGALILRVRWSPATLLDI